MRAADHLIDMGPGAGEHGGYVVAQGTAAEVEAVPESLTGQFLSGARQIEVPAKRRTPSGYVEIAGATQHNLKNVDVEGPARRRSLRDRRVGLGQVDARQRGALQGGREPAEPRADAAGRAQADRRARAARQDHHRRPVADRPHAALEPGDLHRAVRPDPRPVLQDAGGAGARLQARPLLVQRQGRALRGLPRRRPDQDRDALPAGRLRAVRAVPRQALQPRDARHPLQGQDDRRRARDADRGGARVLRAHPEDPAPAADAARRRARLHAARPAGDDAVGRRGAARQARDRAVARSRRAGRSTSSTSRRPACTSPTSRGCSRCCSGSSTRATRSS